MTARQEGVKHTAGRAQVAGQYDACTFVCVGRHCVAKFDDGGDDLPHAENAAYAALAWNDHSQLTAEVARLSKALIALRIAEQYDDDDARLVAARAQADAALGGGA